MGIQCSARSSQIYDRTRGVSAHAAGKGTEMVPPSWRKQPSEKRRLAFDATKALIAGDTIDSYEAKIFNAAGEDLSATIIAASTNTDTVVYVWVQAGTTGLSYFLKIKITTTFGEIIEDDLALEVVEKHK